MLLRPAAKVFRTTPSPPPPALHPPRVARRIGLGAIDSNFIALLRRRETKDCRILMIQFDLSTSKEMNNEFDALVTTISASKKRVGLLQVPLFILILQLLQKLGIVSLYVCNLYVTPLELCGLLF